MKRGQYFSDLGNGYYRNPVLYADYSDPDVIRVGEDFYMTASSFTYLPGLPILHSKDLVNWEIINYAAKRIQPIYDTPKHGCGVWAPAIRYHDGRFYIYYGDPDLGVMMTSTDDIYGEWEPVICVKEGRGLIDTCPLWGDDGRAYIVHGYAKSRAGFASRLAVFEMTPDGKKAITDDVVVFDGISSHPTLEGPKFYKRDNMYYILAPAGGVETGWQVAFRSENVYGPYEDKIVLRAERARNAVNGPHQGGLVELESGESWFIHFRDLEVIGRILYLEPVEWKNGWPAMGRNIDSGCCGIPVNICKKPDVGAQYPITAIATDDDFTGKDIGLQWQWQSNPRDGRYEMTGSALRIYNEAPIDAAAWVIPNVLTQLWQSPSFISTVKVSIPRGIGNNKAALGTIGLAYGYIALRDDGYIEFKTGVVSEGTGVPEETLVYDKIVTDTEIYLRLEIMAYTGAFDCIAKCSYSYDGVHFREVGEFKPLQGKWIGAKTALFVCGEDGGYAEFSDFKVE